MIIELEEFQPVTIPKDTFQGVWARNLLKNFSAQLSVNSPDLVDREDWTITSLGYVGFIPVSDTVGLHLKPKVGLSNLFRMLDIAYKVNLEILDGEFQIGTLIEFYEKLAEYLAKRVLARGRKGYYRTYESFQEEVPYLRERLELGKIIRSPWRIPMECNYHENTADIEENKILAWTLETILRSGLLSTTSQPIVRKAYKELAGLVTSIPYRPIDCIKRTYNRLNEDYQPLHWLCRFFLEYTGPNDQLGDHQMSPFLIDMSYLFEVFVAEWLEKHLPEEWNQIPQYNVSLGQESLIKFKIDLVIRNAINGQAICVLDTKYKRPSKPSSDDVAQIVTYAELMACNKGVLVYPSTQTASYDYLVGGKRISSLVFDLSQNLDTAGRSFLAQVKSFIEN